MNRILRNDSSLVKLAPAKSRKKASTGTRSMKQATQRTKVHDNSILPGLQLQRRLREGSCILLSAIAVFLVISLISYVSEDPGWSHTGQDELIVNAGGRTGAWFADVLFSLFGYVAYLVPWAFFYAGSRLFRQVQTLETPLSLWIARILGLFITLLGACGLIALHFSLNSSLPMGTGGVLGSLLKQWILPQLNWIGSTVTLLALALSGITLFTGFSWIQCSEYLGKLAFWLLNIAKQLFFGWWQKREDRRKLAALASTETLLEAPVDEELQSLAKSLLKQRKKSDKTETLEKNEKIEQAIPIVELPKEPLIIERRTEKEKTVSVSYKNVPLEGGLPSLTLLESEAEHSNPIKGYSEAELTALSRMVETRLLEFGVQVNVVGVLPGPVITRFELDLAAGVKVSKVSSLAKDLARALSVVSVRVVEVIPGKSYVGIEIPNTDREVVRLKEILDSQDYEKASSPLTMALGKDIAGNPIAVDLAKMPHLLVAGTTGSGKSVGLNAMLLSILYKATPEDARLILIDPKMLELAIYEGIPHLLTPVVTDMKDAASALRWCVAEMERRYQLMAQVGVRNLAGFNRKIQDAEKAGEPILDPLVPPGSGQEALPLQKLPYIVVLIDEFADMIMVVGKKVEELIARIAQKARAAGIHLILATQRPSVDVITGLIKANIPTRIAFQVSSRIDSRTILDQQGAEQLLGHGDMLYLPPGTGVPIRVHGAFVADEEVHKVVASWRAAGTPHYIEDVLQNQGLGFSGNSFSEEDQDPLYDEAVKIVTESRKASISQVQRRLKIGYNRAARLLEIMEQAGVVSSMQSNGSREVLAPPPV